MEEGADEEVFHFAFDEGAGDAVAGVGEEELLEVFVGADERVGDLEGGGGVDVVVVLAADEEEVAFEAVGVDDVGVLGIGGIDGPSHELLVPPEFVEAVVVAAAEGDGGFVEVVVPEEGGERVLPAGGPAEDAHAADVEPRVACGGGFQPEDAVGEAGVAEVFVADVVEGLGAAGGAHAVDADDDEAEFGEDVGEVVDGEEGGGEAVAVGAGVDLLEDGIAFVGVEARGEAEDAPDVGFAVAALGVEDDGHGPAGGGEVGDVLALEFGDDGAVGGAAESGDGGAVGAGGVVDEDGAVGGEGDVVVGVAGGEVAPARAVERGHAEVALVGAFGGVDAGGGEPDLAGGFVHAEDVVDDEGALREGDGAAVGGEAPELPPAGAFGDPEGGEAVGEVAQLACLVVDEGAGALLEAGAAHAVGIDFPERDGAEAALGPFEGEGFGVGAPTGRGHEPLFFQAGVVQGDDAAVGDVDERGQAHGHVVPRAGVGHRAGGGEEGVKLLCPTGFRCGKG